MDVKTKTFSGGYSFCNFEGSPRKEVVEFPIPSKITILFKKFNKDFGHEVTPTVKPGDSVKAGQIIGISDATVSNPVHSSVNGKVEEILKIHYFNEAVTAAVISPDGTSDWEPLEQGSSGWKELSAEKIEQLLYLSGAASLGRYGIPTRHKSSPIMPGKVNDIIISGVSSDPYTVFPSVFLEGGRISAFYEGIEILHAIMPDAKIRLAYDKVEKFAEEPISVEMAKRGYLGFYPLKPIYPQGNDELLISSILGKTLPYGTSAPDAGIIILDFQAVLQVRDAIAEGKPVIERIIALSGPGWKENVYLKVRIGTPVKELTDIYLKRTDKLKGNEKLKGTDKYRLVFDNILTNKALSDEAVSNEAVSDEALSGEADSDFPIPVGRENSQLSAIPENTKRQLLAFARPGLHKHSYSRSFLANCFPYAKKTSDTNIHGEERPCIFCGFCDEVCPSGIIPHLIEKYAARDMLDEQVVKLGLFSCIGCNLCSFVCPSKIPVAAHIKEAQEKMAAKGGDD